MTENNIISFSKKKNESEERKMNKIEKSLKIETDNSNIEVEDGHKFLKNLKKEASRQKSMKKAENLIQQALDVEFLPTVESVSEEIVLADSFEIIEED